MFWLFRMEKRIITFCLTAIIIIFFQKTILAQINLQSRYVIRNWTNEDGLTSNVCLAVVQSEDGYIWVGNYDGLMKFNGVKIENFSQANIPQIQSNTFFELLSDGEVLYCATTSGFLVKKKNEWKNLSIREGVPSKVVEAICKDKNKIWLGTTHGICFFENNKISTKNIPPELLKNRIYDIFLDSKENLWIATSGQGIFKLKNNILTHFDENNGLLNNFVYTITEDADENIWVGTRKGINIIYGNIIVGKFENDFENKPLNNVYKLFRDSKNIIWVNTNEKICIFENGKFSNYLDERFFEARSIIEDKEKNIWIGSERNGLFRLYKPKFTSFSLAEGLEGKVVFGICETKNNEILVATDNGISIIQNQKVKTFLSAKELPVTEVKDVFQDSKENIWISTKKGLIKIDKNGKQKIYTQKDGLSDNYARLILEDRNGNFWIGTTNGLNFLQNGKITSYFVLDGLANNYILSLFEDNEGTIWVSTKEGISKFQNQKFISFGKKDNSIENPIFRAYQDKENTIWFGANGGIVVYKNKKFKTIPPAAGFPNETILQIFEDKKNNFWIACNVGIFTVKKSDLELFLDGKITKIPYHLYSKVDGLREKQCTANARNLVTQNGKFWFATFNGAVTIDPENIPINKEIPNVHIEKIFVQDSVFSMREKIVLSPSENRLELHFSALSYIAPDKINFQYKLEGFDKQWITTNKREIIFTNFPVGKFTFKLKASNNDNIWNEKGVSIIIQKKPYFYQTLWFWGIIIVLSTLTFAIIYSLRVKILKAQKEKLEKLVKERTIEIRKQNEEILEKNEELNQLNEEISAQNEEIKYQHDTLSKQQKKITDSIIYASRIQRALLPDIKILEKVFSDNFIFYKPRDIVSGDFYWCRQIENIFIIAAVDCTGHGVPGAFMSMLGTAFLNEIILRKKILKPNEILNELRRNVKISLGQTGKLGESLDGMDVALCSIDLEINELHYAGAYNSMYLIRKNIAENSQVIVEEGENIETFDISKFQLNFQEVDSVKQFFEFKANKMPVGIHPRDNKSFTNYFLNLQKEDAIYLFSDGYASQFGGNNGEKFRVKRFQELLLSLQDFSMEYQKNSLSDIFTKWCRKYEQLDDILVIGIRI